MNNNKNFATKSTWYPGKRPASSLTAGVSFRFNGEVGTFVCWSGPSFNGIGGVTRRMAVVATEDNRGGVRWSLNMAGSVELV